MIKKTIEVISFSDAEKQMISALQANADSICRAEECAMCPFCSGEATCYKGEFTEILHRLYNYHSTDLSIFESKE